MRTTAAEASAIAIPVAFEGILSPYFFRSFPKLTSIEKILSGLFFMSQNP